MKADVKTRQINENQSDAFFYDKHWKTANNLVFIE